MHNISDRLTGLDHITQASLRLGERGRRVGKRKAARKLERNYQVLSYGQDTDESAQEGPPPFTAEVLLVVASE